ncbi:TCTEX1 domain-containing protein 1-like [Plakobranchus ocellatus]|uniref:TCTEX1 domain-containing protein 1-like n=1 Tax=Plakobranchus ocellatus TaxID=259542 RepID=A0AAV4DEH5_9GAST|nr:TCTEX1 domain-containing protein 1-like [Plakobranchus ocellatus]
MLKRLISAASSEGQTALPSISEAPATDVSSSKVPLSGVKETYSSDDMVPLATLPRPFMAAAQQAKSTATPATPSSKGPSLVGLFASKRLAKQLSSKWVRRRNGSLMGGSRISQASMVQKEPTYRMEPKRKFESTQVRQCIQTILDSRLERFPYNPKFCANMSRILSDEIKRRVKAMNFDRYKIICSVTIGEQKGQGVHVTSRCAWDEKLDTFATYTFQNEKIFCTATVFGVYNE